MKKNRTETMMREKAMKTILFILLFLVLIGVLIENLFQFPKVPRSGDNIEEAPARLQNPADFLCRQW